MRSQFNQKLRNVAEDLDRKVKTHTTSHMEVLDDSYKDLLRKLLYELGTAWVTGYLVINDEKIGDVEAQFSEISGFAQQLEDKFQELHKFHAEQAWDQWRIENLAECSRYLGPDLGVARQTVISPNRINAPPTTTSPPP